MERNVPAIYDEPVFLSTKFNISALDLPLTGNQARKFVCRFWAKLNFAILSIGYIFIGLELVHFIHTVKTK
ncbi:MAG: hypothetical protein C5B59_20840 [Bacteroidetes bacterium]|nr:MAG: hypothetical protein C5B59_20840 [Bacteroidota bacterium]